MSGLRSSARDRPAPTRLRQRRGKRVDLRRVQPEAEDRLCQSNGGGDAIDDGGAEFGGETLGHPGHAAAAQDQHVRPGVDAGPSLLDEAGQGQFVITLELEDAQVRRTNRCASRQRAREPVLILDLGDPLVNRLMLFDSLSMEFSEVKIDRNPNCPVCGDSPTITQYIDYVEFCAR